MTKTHLKLETLLPTKTRARAIAAAASIKSNAAWKVHNSSPLSLSLRLKKTIPRSHEKPDVCASRTKHTSLSFFSPRLRNRARGVLRLSLSLSISRSRRSLSLFLVGSLSLSHSRRFLPADTSIKTPLYSYFNQLSLAGGPRRCSRATTIPRVGQASARERERRS